LKSKRFEAQSWREVAIPTAFPGIDGGDGDGFVEGTGNLPLD
jgi:hypothetical protein